VQARFPPPHHAGVCPGAPVTKTQDTLISRALAHRAHWASGGFAEKDGAPCSEFKAYPFLVLSATEISRLGAPPLQVNVSAQPRLTPGNQNRMTRTIRYQ